MRFPTACVLLAMVVLGCARSAEDRKLDRTFAHQAALRDTTGTAMGQVIDSATGAPLSRWQASGGRLPPAAARGHWGLISVALGLGLPVVVRALLT